MNSFGELWHIKRLLCVCTGLVLWLLTPRAWAQGSVVSEKGCTLQVEGTFKTGSMVLILSEGATPKAPTARGRVKSSQGGRSKVVVVGDKGVCGTLKGAKVVERPVGRRPGHRGRVLASGGLSILNSTGLQVDTKPTSLLKPLHSYYFGLHTDLYPLMYLKKPTWLYRMFGVGVRYQVSTTIPAVPVEGGGTLSTTAADTVVYGVARYSYGAGKKWETALLGGYALSSLTHTPQGVVDGDDKPFSPLRNISFSSPFLGLRQSWRVNRRWSLEMEMGLPLGGSATGSMVTANEEDPPQFSKGMQGHLALFYSKKSWTFYFKGGYGSLTAAINGKEPVSLSTSTMTFGLGGGWLL